VSTLRLLLALLALGAILQLPGCSDTKSSTASDTVTVSPVDEDQVYVCPTWSAGENEVFPDLTPEDRDDYHPFAFVPVRVRNRPYEAFATDPVPSPYENFRITELRVQWTAIVSGDPERLADLQRYDFESGFDLSVPNGSEVVFDVLVLPARAKEEAPLVDLADGQGVYPGDGSVPGFVAEVKLTFIGHDAGSTHEIEVATTTQVEFVGVSLGD
jgi:hypothetical protein